MSTIDIIILVSLLALILLDGLRKGLKRDNSVDYVLAGRALPWWAMGLSIMATQASAVTLVGTTGKGFFDGTGFVQFYYALPLAMLILAFTAVPFFQRAKVSTAYEYLERRFDRRTRLMAASTFLVLRCLSLGVILGLPSALLAEITGWPLGVMVASMGFVAVVYTAVGGLAAVVSTDVKQMVIMVCGIVAIYVVAIQALPADIGLAEVWKLGDAAGKTELANWDWDPKERYTIWSSLLAGTLLFLAYFGTDQSQVQRYLAGRSLKHMRGALLLNALVKVPFQLAILLLGVLLFCWSLYEPTPLVFQSQARELATSPEHIALQLRFEKQQLAAGEAGQAYLSQNSAATEQDFRAALRAVDGTRREAKALRRSEQIEEKSDANYVVPWFLLHRLPVGLVGLFLAAIFAAVLSSIDSELNSLATVATIDLRGLDPDDNSDENSRRIIRSTRAFTVLFGLMASCFAPYALSQGAIIEVVNQVGSWFYGALLGVFLLAWLVPHATALGATSGLLAGIAAALLYNQFSDGAFLWMNLVGTGACVIIGIVVSGLSQGTTPHTPAK